MNRNGGGNMPKIDISGICFHGKKNSGRPSGESYVGFSVYTDGNAVISFSREAMEDFGFIVGDYLRAAVHAGYLILLRGNGGWKVSPKSKSIKKNPELIGTSAPSNVKLGRLQGIKPIPLNIKNCRKSEVRKEQGAVFIPIPSEALENA